MDTWKKILFPVTSLFVLFMVDGLIATFFNGSLYTGIGYIVPRLTIILLIVFCFYLTPNYMFFLATLFGYFFDSYYTGYLGPYIAAFWLVVYFVYQLRQVLKPGIITYAIVGTIMFTFFEFFIFGIYSVIGLNEITVTTFLTTIFFATLLFNVFVLVVFSPLLGKFAKFVTGPKGTYEGI